MIRPAGGAALAACGWSVAGTSTGRRCGGVNTSFESVLRCTVALAKAFPRQRVRMLATSASVMGVTSASRLDPLRRTTIVSTARPGTSSASSSSQSLSSSQPSDPSRPHKTATLCRFAHDAAALRRASDQEDAEIDDGQRDSGYPLNAQRSASLDDQPLETAKGPTMCSLNQHVSGSSSANAYDRPRPSVAEVQEALRTLDPAFEQELSLHASRSSQLRHPVDKSRIDQTRDLFSHEPKSSSSQLPTATPSHHHVPQPLNEIRFRTVVEQDVQKAESTLLSSLPRYDLVIGDHRRTALAHINHVLYLAARVPSTRSFNRVSHILEDLDLVGDSYTHSARMVLLDRTNQLHKVPGAWKEYLAHRRARRGSAGGLRALKFGGDQLFSSERDAASTTVLLNTMLWMYAKRARWDVVQPVYSKLLRNIATSSGSTSLAHSAWEPEGDDAGSVSSPDSFAIQDDMSPDWITYTSLIRALAWHGRFQPAISVLQDLVADPRGYSPDPSLFVSLFQGFGRFGEIGRRRENAVAAKIVRSSEFGDSWLSTIAPGDTTDPEPAPRIFPEPFWPSVANTAAAANLSEDVKPGAQFFTRQPFRRQDDMSTFRRLTDLWSQSSSGVDEMSAEGIHAASAGRPLQDNPWTLTALEQLFMAFLALRPGRRSADTTVTSEAITDVLGDVEDSSNRAPSPRALYYILVAFARTTGEDKEVLRTVWADLEAKFGPHSQESWVGWKVDRRLERLIQRFEDDE